MNGQLGSETAFFLFLSANILESCSVCGAGEGPGAKATIRLVQNLSKMVPVEDSFFRDRLLAVVHESAFISIFAFRPGFLVDYLE